MTTHHSHGDDKTPEQHLERPNPTTVPVRIDIDIDSSQARALAHIIAHNTGYLWAIDPDGCRRKINTSSVPLFLQSIGRISISNGGTVSFVARVDPYDLSPDAHRYSERATLTPLAKRKPGAG
ncbi:hypothetical protein CCYS_09625 [Corynebacterium cystitidis DSM 20524]|uniref:Uncharacterized protein n=1 Tax=Corynebacterium cystitidis DSM 20524 TaxID=1121357 RepID=A0A1H9WM71_9CORY|nr:hypothetical protein CCYS_09625 [Corynebacterium cystitidis DSM 20524]SES35036.1 hypothetical protein SAMN05661109_02812 [Corynebacterium cystitidis DSM 20524]SNV69949.1 Uncharacterised protein [Corynebacterium cystitidis]